MDNFDTKKVGKGVIAAGVALIMSASGCGYLDHYDDVLRGTKLYETHVITFEDGSADVACKKCNTLAASGIYYESIISGITYSDTDNDDKDCYEKRNIASDEFINAYLTSDEITKAINDELTDEDCAKIVARIVTKSDDALNKTKK